MSGRAVVFHTAVAVVRLETGLVDAALVPVTVRFRVLSDDEIEQYLRTEQPYDCAGSAKVETLGIALLESLQSDDPTSLVGLPLIATCALLRQRGHRSVDACRCMTGRLYLVPNALDVGVPETAAPDLQDVLPLGVIRIAASLRYWVVENAKSTRAFLKRVNRVVPLAQPLQQLSVVELPRAAKGSGANALAPGLTAFAAPGRTGSRHGFAV